MACNSKSLLTPENGARRQELARQPGAAARRSSSRTEGSVAPFAGVSPTAQWAHGISGSRELDRARPYRRQIADRTIAQQQRGAASDRNRPAQEDIAAAEAQLKASGQLALLQHQISGQLVSHHLMPWCVRACWNLATWLLRKAGVRPRRSLSRSGCGCMWASRILARVKPGQSARSYHRQCAGQTCRQQVGYLLGSRIRAQSGADRGTGSNLVYEVRVIVEDKDNVMLRLGSQPGVVLSNGAQ